MIKKQADGKYYERIVTSKKLNLYLSLFNLSISLLVFLDLIWGNMPTWLSFLYGINFGFFIYNISVYLDSREVKFKRIGK